MPPASSCTALISQRLAERNTFPDDLGVGSSAVHHKPFRHPIEQIAAEFDPGRRFQDDAALDLGQDVVVDPVTLAELVVGLPDEQPNPAWRRR